MNFIEMGTGSSKAKKGIAKLASRGPGVKKPADETKVTLPVSDGKAARAREGLSTRQSLNMDNMEPRKAPRAPNQDKEQFQTQTSSKAFRARQSTSRPAVRETTASQREKTDLRGSKSGGSAHKNQSSHEGSHLQQAASFGSEIYVPGILPFPSLLLLSRNVKWVHHLGFGLRLKWVKHASIFWTKA